MQRRTVEYRMDRVEPQAVNMTFRNPVERILNEETADRIAVAIIEIDCVTPRRSVAAAEIRPEVFEAIPFGAHVVINNVEHNGDFTRMTCVDKPHQALRSAITILRCIR